jgi:hypothetical protein
MQKSAQLMSLFVPGHEMQEAQNKIEAFRLFAYVDDELRFTADTLGSLEALVRRALRLSDYQKIWALEGVAHCYTGAKQPVSGLLMNRTDHRNRNCAMR